MSKRAQRGFTLVELLVVVGIMATLAAVVIPNVGRFVAPARAAADIDELDRVQAAIDTYIAETTLPVAENLVPIRSFTAPTDPALYPGYLREAITRCLYAWDATGQITSQSGCS